MAELISLNGGDWQFKGYIGEDWSWRKATQPGSRDGRGWRPGCVPGSVAHDLWRTGEIPNPYFERNSLLIEWIPQRTWLYRKSFFISEDHRGRRMRLHFKGVDYQAQFFLNGVSLGEHTGMFTPATFEVSDLLHYGDQNLLVVVIEHAPDEQPQVGRTSRTFTHKSRMTYWWDFCPRMVHLGIWDEVFLEASGPIRIEDIQLYPRLADDFRQAQVEMSIQLSSLEAVSARLEALLEYNGQVVSSQSTGCSLAAGMNRLTLTLHVDHPQLWWPNGYGEQPLYQARLDVREQARSDQEILDQRQVSFGLRKLAFVPNDDAEPEARPYTLVVNGRKIYLKGWNWVPMDVLYGVERPRKLKRLLNLARDAHVNILRVWGGGLIEKDAFYEACDRLGILVWQEFILSSSGIENVPPDSPQFIQFMEQEARQIIRLKRNHPSLALWCGGNELQSGPDRPADDTQPLLAALRAVVRESDPGRCWLPTSPSGREFGNSLQSIARDPQGLHDVHGPWEFQGVTGQCALYNQGASLLHSEFGVEGLTNLRTLNRVISPDKQSPVSLDNPVWEHLGAWWVKTESWRQAFGDLPDVETTVKATQFLQAAGLGYAVEADRRRKYHNSGTLPWQFNEPYPMAASTSAVDYFTLPKPAYYAVKRAYAPLTVSAQFPTLAWGGQPAFEAQAWVSNSRQVGAEHVMLHMALVGAGGRIYASQEQEVAFAGNVSTCLADCRWSLDKVLDEVFFLDLRLTGEDGQNLAANRYIFGRSQNLAPLLRVRETHLAVSDQPQGDHCRLQIANTGQFAALFVWLEDDLFEQKFRWQMDEPVESFYFEDNGFCLLPGESRVVAAVGEEDGAFKMGRLLVSAWNAHKEQVDMPRVGIRRGVPELEKVG